MFNKVGMERVSFMKDFKKAFGYSSLIVMASGHSIAFAQEEVSLFDGKTLDGWSVNSEDKDFWSVQDGMIVGDNGAKNVPRNTYLFSEKQYEHFEFSCKFRLTGDATTGVINSGVQFRSQNKDWHPIGYQADIGGPSWWGGIFEEGGRRKLAPADMKKVLPVVKENDWNNYVIRANGPRIQLFINGLETVNYLEKVPSTPYKGHFAIQLHKGGAAKIEMKEIMLKKLDGGVDPSDSAAWKAAKDRITYEELQISNTPLTPKQELEKFQVPEGYEVELVAQESEGIGKFITVDFDKSGKMWSMTALDYPVDAKKDKAKSEALFKAGGKDKVLVFDTPTAAGVQTPRVFATDLAIPLGMMPYKNGAIAQYGPDIRFYQDTDGDGISDKYDVLLTGFGIQDSHLFPHQFTRGPGGWMYLAQGLSNASTVKRPDGKAFTSGGESVKYDRCRVARMQLDGSDFQYTTTGPNNVWGIVPGRDGEWFIQEANDKGYPVAKYDFGVYLNTGGTPKIKSFQPILPPVFETAIMGGTGLSGLVLAEDIDSPFAQEGKKTFYIANPLTSAIQIVTATPLGNNRFKWEKQEDFLVSGDRWFRPVGIKFGPDGALYVVDWYNKIIAHGEVAQNHPDRDKVRGRIWRITKKGHKHTAALDLAKASDQDLLKHLSDKNALVQRLTWLEIIDRKATALVPELQKKAQDAEERLDVRLAALWACEGIGGVSSEMLSSLASDKHHNMRAEVVKVSGRISETAVFAAIAKSAANDKHVRVRNALGEALVSRNEHDANTMHAAALLGKESIKSEDRLTNYEREFERFLSRWAMENNPEQTSVMLGLAADLPVENRLLAMQSLKPSEAALAFLPMIPKLDRNLSTIELSLITGQLSQEKVLGGFRKLLFDQSRQRSMIEALSKAEPGTPNKILNKLLVEASRQFVKRDASLENKLLVMKTAQRYRLAELKSDVAEWILQSKEPSTIVTGLKCLRELGPVDSKLCETLVSHSDEKVQREAVISLATAEAVEVITLVKGHWSLLSATDKPLAINGFVNSKAKALALGQAILKGDFSDINNGSLEQLIIILGDAPEAAKLLEKLGDSVPMIIRMSSNKEDSVESNLSLNGSFTVESWVRLSGKKNLSAGLLSNGTNAGLIFSNGKLEVKTPVGRRKSKTHVTTKAKATSNVWVHYAVVRDQSGGMKVYVDGVLNATSANAFNGKLAELNIGAGVKEQGTGMDVLELRVWDSVKSEAQIRENMQVSLAGGKSPKGLLHRSSGDSEKLSLKGKALIAPASDAPHLITAAKAAEMEATFAKYRKIVAEKGDPVNGKSMFMLCTACHVVNNVGGKIGPDLSGIGVYTDENLLRNILTPNAALEASYYRHDLKMKDGSFLSGFMVNENEEKVTIRRQGFDDKIVLKSQIDTHSISKSSLMPEGLLNGMSDQQVADMFSYMRTLKPTE